MTYLFFDGEFCVISIFFLIHMLPFLNNCFSTFSQGGLHHISWFQFLPNEFDFSSLSDKRCGPGPFFFACVVELNVRDIGKFF